MPDSEADRAPSVEDVVARIRPRRSITGMSAVLLPFDEGGHVDWKSYARQLEHTAGAGLRPAVNMDTGYVQLLDAPTRRRVLEVARAHAGEEFVAGAQVSDGAGDSFDADAVAREVESVEEYGGLPIVFPSHGLAALEPDEWVEAHRGIASRCERFLAFELGPMFVPYGRIYPLEAYGGLMEIPQCLGAKHSSLSRELEWQRLALRDQQRPEFLVLTGNDLAIDMVMYGSDYLLGLSTFAPDLFARRDALWEAGDAAFFELNDALQELGCFAFRAPVPAYKHDAAIFLHLRAWIASDETHPRSPAPARQRSRRARGDRRASGGAPGVSVAARIPKLRRLRTAEALRAHLDAIGVADELPFDDEIAAPEASPLSRPLEIGPRTLGNRFAILPMEGWDGTRDGRPTDLVRRRWGRFGESGAKLVWGGEAVAVRPDGRANPNQLVSTDEGAEDLAALRRHLVAEHEKRHGRSDDLLVGLQLTHSGRWSRPDGEPAPRVVYRHPLLDARVGVRDEDVLRRRAPDEPASA